MKQDYFAKNVEFSLWLKEQKGLFFSDLKSDQAHELFKGFARSWNRGSLEGPRSHLPSVRSLNFHVAFNPSVFASVRNVREYFSMCHLPSSAPAIPLFNALADVLLPFVIPADLVSI